ncbi:MAG: HAMP domain-containing sensor histidine kinase [Acetivibrio sp.]
MKRSLLLKFIVCYILVGLSMFFIMNTYGISRIQHSLMEDKKNVLYSEAGLIASEYMDNYFMKKLSLLGLNTQLRTIDTFLDTRIWFVQSDGSILLDTRDSIAASRDLNLNDLKPGLLDEVFSSNVTIPNIITEPMLSLVYPITSNYALKGYIVMYTSINAIKDDCIYYTDIINSCFLIYLLLLVAVFLYLYFLTVHPLHIITKAAKEYADGHYTYPLKIDSHDEYGDLASSISYMAGELNSLDDYQKKFIANISHDFRSPLTSIKGYAEAMQDGTIPYESQDKYLGIILFETERLNKLTGNLLELNSFKNNGVLLDMTTFDINQVIKQTAQAFEGICTKKNMQLDLVFSEKKTYVCADIGKIQQVLYNLIDNAIKFSPDDSKIKISSEEQSEKVFLSVKDYGVGIPKERLKKVWDRFYKIDTSRGKDKKGTGLGLSITKEIINAHGENINLISTEGIGSEFIFTLAKAVDNYQDKR